VAWQSTFACALHDPSHDAWHFTSHVALGGVPWHSTSHLPLHSASHAALQLPLAVFPLALPAHCASHPPVHDVVHSPLQSKLPGSAVHFPLQSAVHDPVHSADADPLHLPSQARLKRVGSHCTSQPPFATTVQLADAETLTLLHASMPACAARGTTSASGAITARKVKGLRIMSRDAVSKRRAVDGDRILSVISDQARP
jgi:hypothetical protein